MRHIELIINPRAGRGRGGEIGLAIVDRLRAGGVRCRARFTAAPRDAMGMVENAYRDGTREVVIAGGDGSIFEAVNGYMRAGVPDARLGIVPIGSGNDFVKMFALDQGWESACERLLVGAARRVDVGRCNDVFFANGVGVGLDAQVALEANRVRHLRGDAIYLAALARTLMSGKLRSRAELIIDDLPSEREVTLIAVANGRCYGGCFQVAPGAAVDDGRLELIYAEGLSVPGILGLVPKVMRGTHLGHPAVHHQSVQEVRVRMDQPMVLHADGEILDEDCRAVDVQVVPKALALLG